MQKIGYDTFNFIFYEALTVTMYVLKYFISIINVEYLKSFKPFTYLLDFINGVIMKALSSK